MTKYEQVETYIDGLNEIFTSTILESPPHHRIYFRWKSLSDNKDHKSALNNGKTSKWARAIWNDVLMILYDSRLAEVRRLENFLDGCQNRVPSHFHWTLPFILTLFIEKSDCKCRPRQNRVSGGCLVPIFKGGQFWRFLFGPSLDQEVETVWRNKSNEKICPICLKGLWLCCWACLRGNPL